MAKGDYLKQICECGCSRNWHSISTTEWIPANSGCLCCKKCTKFKEKINKNIDIKKAGK